MVYSVLLIRTRNLGVLGGTLSESWRFRLNIALVVFVIDVALHMMGRNHIALRIAENFTLTATNYSSRLFI